MNKQIEELSTKFYFADNMTNDDRWSCNELAEFVISNGYRKSTDVASEIFEEIEKILTVDESGFGTLAECGLEEGFSYCETYVHNLRNKLAELKKKYESEGAE